MNAISKVDRPARSQTVLWQGRPAPRAAAIHIWHLRLVAAWFALLLADGAWRLWHGRAPLATALDEEARLLLVGLCTVTILVVLACLTARTTVYTITDHAVIMRIGIALHAKLIIPFAAIAHVGVRIHADQSGDLALRLIEGQSVAYAKLWPHARPWRLFRPEPMLRAIEQPGIAGAILCRALAGRRPPSAENSGRSAQSDAQARGHDRTIYA